LESRRREKVEQRGRIQYSNPNKCRVPPNTVLCCTFPGFVSSWIRGKKGIIAGGCDDVSVRDLRTTARLGILWVKVAVQRRILKSDVGPHLSGLDCTV